MHRDFLSEINLWTHINYYDLGIIIFFAISFLFLPHMVPNPGTEHKKGDQGFLLMGRSLSLPLFVATLVSTWYGGIFGVTQIAFEKGFYSFCTQGLFWYFSYFVFALFFVKKVRQKQVLSLPELIGQKFGYRARRLSGLILFFHALPLTYALSIGILLQMIFAIDFPLALMLGVSLVAIYTASGGFRGVVVTDALQFLLMFFAAIIFVIFLFYNFGFMTFLSNTLPQSYFDWRGDKTWSQAFIWLFIACSTTLIHPVFYQRCLAASSDRVAIRGILISIFCWLVFDCCTTLGGMYAKAIIPTADSEKAYVYLAVQLLPAGLRGIFLAGIMATILSTLDSFLFVSGTSLSYDVFSGQKNSQKAHKLAIIGTAALVIFVALLFGVRFEEIWLFMEGIFSTALVVPVLAALFIRKSLSSWHFFAPVSTALLIYALGSLWRHYYDINFSPFYWAHGAALGMFILCSIPYALAKSRTARVTM